MESMQLGETYTALVTKQTLGTMLKEEEIYSLTRTAFITCRYMANEEH